MNADVTPREGMRPLWKAVCKAAQPFGVRIPFGKRCARQRNPWVFEVAVQEVHRAARPFQIKEEVQSSSVLYVVPQGPGKAWCSRLLSKMQCQGGQVSV